MNPAPPVTSTFMRPRVVEKSSRIRHPFGARHWLWITEEGKAGAEAIAPVWQQRRARPLGAKHRRRRSRRDGTELGGGDPADAALDSRLLEDRLGEIGPRAIPSGGEMIEPFGQLEQHPG